MHAVRRWPRVVAFAAAGLLLALLVDLIVLGSRVTAVPLAMPPVDDDVDTWVIVGSDSRSHAPEASSVEEFGTTEQVPGERADLIILLTVADGTARAVSVPRDLLVTDQGYPMRLAMTLQHGPQRLLDAMCTSLGVPADHFVGLHFDGFVDVVDAAGGVDVTLSHAVRDPLSGLNLRAGRQRIDGAQALALIRSRTSEQLVDGAWVPTTTGVDDRAGWGARVLGALAQRLSDTALAPVTLQRVAWAVTGALWTDDETGLLDLVRVGARSPSVGELPHGPAMGTPPPGAAVPLPPNEQTRETLSGLGLGDECTPAAG